MSARRFPFWRVTGHGTTGPLAGMYQSWPAVYTLDAAGDLLARLATGPDGQAWQRWEIQRHEYALPAVVEPSVGLPLWGAP